MKQSGYGRVGGTPNTVTAWVDWTNAHGGVNGHPVKDIVLDDGSIPSKGISAAKELMADRDEPGPGGGSAGRDSAGDPARGAPVPVPALINLTVPTSTLLTCQTLPAQADAGAGLQCSIREDLGAGVGRDGVVTTSVVLRRYLQKPCRRQRIR